MEINKSDIITCEGGGAEYVMYLPYRQTDFIQKIIANTGKPYEIEMLEDMLQRTKENDLILDIGTNIGNHAICLAANGRKVCGFEANPKMFELAQVNVALNQLQNRVQIHCCGISDKEERAAFGAEIPSNFGAMRLQQIQDGGIICHRLDDFNFNEPIAMIKIDIEGMEDKALRGAKNLIDKNRPILYLEAQKLDEFKRIDRIMLEMDYVHCKIFGGALTHLYIPKEKAENHDLSKAICIIAEDSQNQKNLLYKFYTLQRHDESIAMFGSERRSTILPYLPSYLAALLCARRYYRHWRNDVRIFLYIISFGIVQR
ncbi:MAG: FkbM family methyltransferase [Helicobacter sp.]|nr:FkbM family methyltransferase [Helicobacter sp.]